MPRILSALVLGAIGGLMLFPAIVGTVDPSRPKSGQQAGYASPSVHADEGRSAAVVESRRNAIVRAIERVSPAVVGVHTTYLKEYQVRYRDPFWNFFYPGVVREKTPGIGSGFVIRADGYVLTNHHVVKGAQAVSIVLPDGRRYKVTDIRNNVWIDWQNDLAVIRVDAQDLPVTALSDTADVIIGEWAIAIGNPFGLELEDPQPTVTVGVVSAVGRNFQPDDDGPIYQDMIQTDAPLNPGNS
ncbi:MAG: trypsin-like peptidase domain-containing protein, partial [Candidatus Latescibacteria bacterium]|nr:trypsin-like peptidase domain-containing protein [Candidatus Latescibacterota bacterium]